MNYSIKTQVAVYAVVLLVVAFALTLATSVFAYEHPSRGDDNDITVSIANKAEVLNVVKVEAETGDNRADGGDGEEGGNGGDAEGKEVDNTAGAGGAGGSGALGGLIDTGDAAAYASVLNDINTSRTRVTDLCGCEEDRMPTFGMWFMPRERETSEDNDIRVRVENSASLKNIVEVEAETGDNRADGGDGEEGGNGGDAESKTYDRPTRGVQPFFAFWPQMGHDENVAGAGGAGGDGGIGGEIYTGAAVSGADVVNVLNTTVTRILRR